MAQFFIRRPIVAMVIAIVTVILGLVTLSRLPIAEYPQVSPTLIEVTANYRGAYVFSVGLYILAEVSQLVGSATREAAPDGHRG